MNDNSRTNSISRPVEGLDRAEVLIDRDGDIHLNTAGASGTVYINGVAYSTGGGVATVGTNDDPVVDDEDARPDAVVVIWNCIYGLTPLNALGFDIIHNQAAPPATPTGFVVTPGDMQAVLNWNDNAESDLSCYEYRIDGGTVISTGLTSGVTVTGLTNGVEYDFEVRAVNDSAGVSSWSSVVSATPTATNGLLSNLKAFWPLNEASGNALDLHSGGHTLTDNDTVGAGTGLVYANARDFEYGNTNEFFSKADHADYSFGDVDFGIAAWVKLESKTGVTQCVVAKGVFSADHEWGLYYTHSADRFAFYEGVAGAVGVLANNLGSPSVGQWYLLIARHDPVANLITLSVDNGSEDSTSHSGGFTDGTASLRIGSDGSTRKFDGLIGPVAIWKGSSPNSTQRGQLFNAGAGLPYLSYT